MRKAFLLAAALAALGAAPAAPQSPAVVNVRLSNFDFEPGTIVLDRQRSYVFRLYNASSGGHDFTASDFFRAANVAPADRRWIRDGSVEVPPRAGSPDIAERSPARQLQAQMHSPASPFPWHGRHDHRSLTGAAPPGHGRITAGSPSAQCPSILFAGCPAT